MKKFIDGAKFKEALQIINDFKETGRFSLRERVSWCILKCRCLNRLGQFEQALKLAENVYKESQELEESLQTLDALIELTEALTFLGRSGQAKDLIAKADILLKKINGKPSIEFIKRDASISFVRSKIYFESGEINKFLEFAEHSVKLQEELGSKHEISRALSLYGQKEIFTGEWDQALDSLNKCLTLEEEGFNFNVATIMRRIGAISMFRGELDLALEYNKKGLALCREIGSKIGIANSLNYLGMVYHLQGDFKRAIEHFKQSKKLFKELGNDKYIVQIDSCLFELAIDMNDHSKAQLYLGRIKGYKDLNIFYSGVYRLCKALLLKLNPRAINRGKAEEIFKQLVEEEHITHETKEVALVNLCDLLLIELRNISDPELLVEFQHYINQLMDTSKKCHSYSLLAETYLLKAKLALIKLDLKEARKFFTQAQIIAEKYGIKRLAMKISHEHDILLNQLDRWDYLKKENASLTERIKLAGLNDQMETMIRKRQTEAPVLSDELPVFLLIISEGGTPLFSHSFVQDQEFEDHLFGGFFSAINSFINEKFSEGLDRAIFGEYTLLMSSISPFFMCYIFKGQSYSAQQRIGVFIDKIQNDKDIWQAFEKFYKVSQEIQLKDVPTLKPLIQEIFIDATYPFI
ncbi:MAG: tetratricopeptide repeat protein [Promethearchaeota archaeon]